MTSLLNSQRGISRKLIRARIAEHVVVDVECINDDSHLSEDFGLDLLDIIELMIVLEQQVGAVREITDEPNQIEFVGGLIRHIEQQSIESHSGTWD